jgi:hypothetical protein
MQSWRSLRITPARRMELPSARYTTFIISDIPFTGCFARLPPKWTHDQFRILRMKEIHLILTALAALSALASAAEIQIGSRSTAEAANRYRVASPDGTIEAQLRADKRLSSSVHVDGEPVIGPSRLGLSFGEALQLGQNVRVVDASTSERNESWKDDLGKFSTVKDRGAGCLVRSSRCLVMCDPSTRKHAAESCH